MWKTFFKRVTASLIDLCFPAFCLSCKESLEGEGLCGACAKDLQLIDVKARCPYCFEEKGERECLKEHPLYSASCCIGLGPAAAMARAVDASDPLRQKNIGSLLVVQLCLLGWPVPDLLLPFPPKDPIPLGVAKQMRFFLPVEVRDCLRKSLFTSSYAASIEENLSDKNCLIVSLQKVAQEEKQVLFHCLQLADPKRVFFLSFLE